MLVALFVLLCVVGLLFVLPFIAIVVFFFFRGSSLMQMEFGEDFRATLSKILGELNGAATNVGKRSRDEALSRREALEILGLGPDASEEQITSAYHKLMKSTHPDKGGSAYFAQKLNQARERLLGRRKS